MRKDQVIATVFAAITLRMLLTQEPEPDDLDDRMIMLGLGYALAFGWRLVAKIPVFGLVERMATDYGSADLRIPTAIISWGVFLFICYAVAFA